MGKAPYCRTNSVARANVSVNDPTTHTQLTTYACLHSPLANVGRAVIRRHNWLWSQRQLGHPGGGGRYRTASPPYLLHQQCVNKRPCSLHVVRTCAKETTGWTLQTLQWWIQRVPWVPRNPFFVVLRACVAGLLCAHKCSRKRSGQRNPPFQNPRSATALGSLQTLWTRHCRHLVHWKHLVILQTHGSLCRHWRSWVRWRH